MVEIFFRNYMNDSLRTNVFVRFQPETIACACIYLAARALQIPLPTRPHWFLLFGTTEEEIQEICIETLRLYTRKKPNYELLEKEVEKRKVALQEAKLKAKGLNPDGTPALSTLGGFSPASKPSSPREVKTEEKSPISVNVKTILGATNLTRICPVESTAIRHHGELHSRPDPGHHGQEG